MFTESWVETDPDGSVITVSLLDDHVRLTKRALRERVEGDSAVLGSGVYESGTFGTTAMVKKGVARAFTVTNADLTTTYLQDGRLAVNLDDNTLYHSRASGLVRMKVRAEDVLAGTFPVGLTFPSLTISTGDLTVTTGTTAVQALTATTATLSSRLVAGADPGGSNLVRAATARFTNLGIGGSSSANVGVFMIGTIGALATQGIGFYYAGTISASANSQTLAAFQAVPVFVANGFTGLDCYGLRLGDITGGASNYAIRTGLGLVQFGDTVLFQNTWSLQFGGYTTSTVQDGTGFWMSGNSASRNMAFGANGSRTQLVLTNLGNITSSGNLVLSGSLTTTTGAFSGLITASGGLTLPAGQILTLTGATVAGSPTWSASQAITLSTAAQPNITSVGSLTALTITNGLTVGGTSALQGVTATTLTLSGALSVTGLTVGGGASITGVLSATVVHDFGSIAAGGRASVNVAVAGAVVGDPVFVGALFSGAAGSSEEVFFYGRVTGPNIVELTAYNHSSAARDPDSRTYRVVVFKF